MENKEFEIIIDEKTGNIIVPTANGSRTILTPEFQEEIYELVRERKVRKILENSPLINSVVDEGESREEEIKMMIPFYTYRMDKSNEKDSEDFCWLAIIDYDHEIERMEAEAEEEGDFEGYIE